MLTQEEQHQLEKQLSPAKEQIDKYESRIIFLENWCKELQSLLETEENTLKKFEIQDKIQGLELEIQVKTIAIQRRKAFIQAQINHVLAKKEQVLVDNHFKDAINKLRSIELAPENKLLKQAIERNFSHGYKNNFEQKKIDFNKIVEITGYNAHLV